MEYKEEKKTNLKYKKFWKDKKDISNKIIGYYWDYTCNSNLPVYEHSSAYKKARMKRIIRADEDNPYY